MKTKSLITCANSVMAENLKQLLADEGIVCSINDQTLNKAVAFGANVPGYEIIVKEEDYERAKVIADSVEEERNEMMPWCPECGSEDVYYNVIHIKGKKPIIHFVLGTVVGLFLIFYKIPVFWNYVVAVIFLVVIIVWYLRYKPLEYDDREYHCRKCGKIFMRS